jgi:hypothetical protein
MARSISEFATLISPGCTLQWFAFDFLRPLLLQSAVANSVAMTAAVEQQQVAAGEAGHDGQYHSCNQQK